MSADDLIAALQGGLRVDAEGSFTLNREKAREKLRTFQVAEPQRYVLHLIALATLKGATAVHVRCDSDDVVVRFDGAPVTAADLDDLYGSSFSHASSDVQRARQQLAVGIHAALALNPRFVRVSSGAGESAVSMVARHGAADEIGGATPGAPEGTEIHVKQRFRPGLVVRFVQHLRGALAEATWLRERCRYATRPVFLNGESITAGMTIAGAKHAFVHSVGTSRGVAGIVDGFADGLVRLVRHGVWLQDVAQEHLPRGFVAVISDDLLLTDLSGDKVVQDEHHARCMAVADALAAAVIESVIGAVEVDADATLERRLAPVWWASKEVVDAGTAIGRAVGRVRRWRDIFGRWHSTERLRAVVAEKGHVPVTRGEFAERLPVDEEVVLLLPPSGTANDVEVVLGRLFGEGLRDVTAALEEAARVEANRRRWRAQPAAPTLTPASYHLTAPFAINLGGAELRGEVGLRRAPTTKCSLRVIVDGCMLKEFEIEAPIAGIDAVIGGALPVLPDCSGPVAGEALAACLGAWVASSRLLAETAIARGLIPEPTDARAAFIHGYLRSMYRSEALRAILAATGFDDVALTTRLRHLLRTLPPVAPAKDLCTQPWIRAAYVFTTARGESIDAGAIGLLLERGVKVEYVPEQRASHPRIEAPVLRVSVREAEALRWLYGGRVQRMTDEAYAAALAQAHFFDRPPAQGVLSEETCTPHVTVVHAGLRIGAAFARVAVADGSVRAPCEVVVHGRRLGEAWIAAPVSGVRFAIAGEGLTIKPTWDGVVLDEAFAAAGRAAVAALPGLVAAGVAALADETDAGLRAAWLRGITGALTATFPTPGLRTAFALLFAAHGSAAAERQFVRLLALRAAAGPAKLEALLAEPGVDAAVLADAREVAVRLGVAPPDDVEVEALSTTLARLRAALGQVGGGSWLADVGRCSPEVAALPLLRREDGTRATLAQLAGQMAGGGVHVVVDPEDATWPHMARASKLVDGPTRGLLRALYDDDRLRISASADDAGYGTAADLIALMLDLRTRGTAPRVALTAIPRLIALAIAGCRGAGAEAAEWRRGLVLALGVTFPAPLLRLKYRALHAAFAAADAEVAYCRLLQEAEVGGMEAVVDRMTGMPERRLVEELRARAGEPEPGLRRVLAATREALGQVGASSLLESVWRFSEEVRGLPLFERIDGTAVTVGEVADAAASGGVYVYAGAARHERPLAYLRSLRVGEERLEVLRGVFGSEKIETAAPDPRDAGEAPQFAAPKLGGLASEAVPEWLALAKLDALRGPEDPVPPPPLEVDDGGGDDDIRAVFASVRQASGPNPKAGPVKTFAPPKPPEPTPADRMIAAIQSELHALRRGHESLLTGFNLDHVRASAGPGEQAVRCERGGVVLDTHHPRIAAAIAGHAKDRMWVTFLVSQVYTALNVWREDITDAHEEAFHARHLAWLRGEFEPHG